MKYVHIILLMNVVLKASLYFTGKISIVATGVAIALYLMFLLIFYGGKYFSGLRKWLARGFHLAVIGLVFLTVYETEGNINARVFMNLMGFVFVYAFILGVVKLYLHVKASPVKIEKDWRKRRGSKKKEDSFKLSFEDTREWSEMRYAMIASAKGSCDHCRVKGERLEVYHKVSIWDDWKRRLDPSNLVVLCNGCAVSSKLFTSGMAWRSLRRQKIDGELKRSSKLRCVACKVAIVEGENLDVDHIVPKSVDPSKAYDLDNLQLMCRRCNEGKSNKYAIDHRDQGRDDFIEYAVKFFFGDSRIANPVYVRGISEVPMVLNGDYCIYIYDESEDGSSYKLGFNHEFITLLILGIEDRETGKPFLDLNRGEDGERFNEITRLIVELTKEKIGSTCRYTNKKPSEVFENVGIHDIVPMSS